MILIISWPRLLETPVKRIWHTRND